jgi:hypothetical protein
MAMKSDLGYLECVSKLKVLWVFLEDVVSSLLRLQQPLFALRGDEAPALI